MLLFLVFLLVIQSVKLLNANSAATFVMEEVCGFDGFKQSLYLNSDPSFFTFKSRNREKFSCHLELHLRSKKMGFYVFIEKLRIKSSPTCSKDFLQFGRDNFLFTTFLSEKYCDNVENSTEVLDEENSLVGYDFKNTSLAQREYVEVIDDEMDVWLELGPTFGIEEKEVNLLVVPFDKHCNKEDDFYRNCPSNNIGCFKRELFCDRILKCDIMNMEEQSRSCNMQVWFLPIPAIIIIVAISIIGTIFIGSGIIKLGLCIFKKKTNSLNGVSLEIGEPPHVQDFEIPSIHPNNHFEIPSIHANPQVEIPIMHPVHGFEISATHSNPPSYEEVMAAEIYSPPSYSQL